MTMTPKLSGFLRASALPPLLLILLVAAYFRLYGIDWDRGYLFHPDEREILLVASRINLPSDLIQFLSPDSPLNPKFFAYGSFSIYLIRVLGALVPSATSYFVPFRDTFLVNQAFVGRALSTLFDLGTIVFLFLLARRLYDSTVGLIAGACVAITVLHIQLAHYYAVDTLVTLFCIATIYFAARYAQIGRTREAMWMSIAFGLALSTKITAFPLIFPIVVATIRARGKEIPGFYSKAGWRIHLRARLDQLWGIRKPLAKIAIATAFMFIVVQPYAVLDPIQYFGQVGTEALVARGWLERNFTIQFAGTLPFVYPVVQSSIWGMGVPLGMFAWGGFVFFIWNWWRTHDWTDGFVLSWALFYYLTAAGQFAKYPRYLIPLTPFLFLMAIVSVRYYAPDLSQWIIDIGAAVIVISTLAYVVTFISIYPREHPWLQISKWIYQNVPAGSNLAIEHWDDALPFSVSVNGATRTSNDYHVQILPMYDPDDEKKLQMVADTLSSSDYIILASQRLYGSISRVPARYPMSSRYYRALFDGGLGYEMIAYARNDPAFDGMTIVDDRVSYAGLALPPLLVALAPNAIVWNWGYEDESLNVYDHPMPLVFKKTLSLSAEQYRLILRP
jgi:dolichyl-phosphate-mannose-protein mannosyltransferase